MLSKIKSWFSDNEMQLTWFSIGVFTMWFTVDIGHQNYLGALFDVLIIATNYIFRPR